MKTIKHSWPLLLLALPMGCKPDTTNADDDGGPSLLAGDLVVTEIMADPEGADDGLEWFEIHNSTSAAIDLEGVTLVYSKVDGTGRNEHVVGRGLMLEAGDSLVVAGVLDEIASASPTDHFDYGFAGDLGSFGNAGGYFAIETGGEVVDEVYYEEATSGASRAFDGGISPDAAANDDLTRWCDSRTEFDGPTFLATPGAANDLCSQDGCLEDGVSRPVVTAGPGDFVITELHGNPGIVDDALGEWFELHALADFDLNGLEIGRVIGESADETILDPDCLAVGNGEYVVIARSGDPALNGGVEAEAIRWVTGVSFKNTDGSLWMAVPGVDGNPGEIIDGITWSTAPDGAATQLDPDFEDAAANDELANWCEATVAFGAGDMGSPGAANEECMIAPPEGQCVDPGTRELRDIEPVAAGDLVITEFLANPEAVGDPEGEWFELVVKSAGDLNGLWIGKAGEYSDQLVSETCLEFDAGEYAVLAHETDVLINGGLAQVDATFDLALNNSNSDLMIGWEVMPGTIELADQITWTATSAAATRSFGGDLNTVANDDLLGWCDGLGVYGDGDLGTPGLANASCGGGGDGMCTDPMTMMDRPIVLPTLGEVELTEVMPNPDAVPDTDGEWFEIHTSAGFDLNGLEFGKSGVVEFTITNPMCMPVLADQWLAFAIDGDVGLNGGVTPVTWVYEGLALTNSNGNLFVGVEGSVLDEFSWVSSPTGATLSRDTMSDMWCPAIDPYGLGDLGTPALANPACGGGMSDECLDGGVPRAIVPPLSGDIVITEFMANPDAVGDAEGEWFELRALADFDLNGLELGNAAFFDGLVPDLTLASNDCIEVVADETLLFARDGDTMVNGGLPPVDFEFGFGVSNSNAFLYVGYAGALLDQIGWTATATGSSTSLDPDFYDPAVNDVANNADPAWCYDATVYGLGDEGTPDADNEQCP